MLYPCYARELSLAKGTAAARSFNWESQASSRRSGSSPLDRVAHFPECRASTRRSRTIVSGSSGMYPRQQRALTTQPRLPARHLHHRLHHHRLPLTPRLASALTLARGQLTRSVTTEEPDPRTPYARLEPIALTVDFESSMPRSSTWAHLRLRPRRPHLRRQCRHQALHRRRPRTLPPRRRHPCLQISYVSAQSIAYTQTTRLAMTVATVPATRFVGSAQTVSCAFGPPSKSASLTSPHLTPPHLSSPLLTSPQLSSTLPTAELRRL